MGLTDFEGKFPKGHKITFCPLNLQTKKKKKVGVWFKILGFIVEEQVRQVIKHLSIQKADL